MATQNFVALDLGAESGRAVVGRFDGEKLDLVQVHRFANHPVRVRSALHWDALRLFDDIQVGLERAAHEAGDIQSVGLDTWGVDFALLDANGELLGNPYHYRDHRTDAMMPEAFRRVPRERIFEATGIQFMQLNTLYQLLAMVVAESPQLSVADRLLMMPDLFNYWLTGEKVSEFSIATTTQFYDPRARGWAVGLLEELGIPYWFLPHIVPPGTELGRLPPPLAAVRGLEKTRVIAPACHDTASAVAAVPGVGERFAYISSGTWSLMGTTMREPVITAQALDYNFTNEGGADGTFRLLKNISGLWIVQECRRAWMKERAELSYADLTALAAQAPAFAAFIDVDDASFLNPDDMPTAIAEYCRRTGQTAPADQGAVVRVALEGLAMKYRTTLAQLETLIGTRIEKLHIVGGGSQNWLLSQFAADACARPVLTGPVEATAMGNILVQMLAQKMFSSLDQARGVVRASVPLTAFEPRDTDAWDEAYARYLKVTAAV